MISLERPAAPVQVQFAGLDARQLHQAFDEAVEPVGLFVYHFEHLAPPFRSRASGPSTRAAQVIEQRGDRSLDGRERRAQVVRDGVEQGGLQTLALLSASAWLACSNASCSSR